MILELSWRFKLTIFFLSFSRSKTLRTYSKLLFLKTRMSLWSTAARCNFRFYEVKNGAMETILGPIQRPFVSVTALFVLREDVEYVTINPDSTINFVGENSAAGCDSNLRHPARLSSFVPWKKKEEKKNYEIFSFHANLSLKPSSFLFSPLDKFMSAILSGYEYLVWRFPVFIYSIMDPMESEL